MFSNPIDGIITLITVFTLCFLAFRAAKKEEYSKALLLIFCSGLLLRIFCGMIFYLHAWDERYHALVAKNMLEHFFTPTLYDNPALDYDYRAWTNNHIWVHKPPMTLWLIAVSLKIFGINEFAVRIPSIILSSLGVLLTYAIARYFFREKVALLGSFFYAINGFLIELATGRWPTDHVDTLFIFFIELGIYFSVRYMRFPIWKNIFFIGVTTGIAVLTKWLPGLIVIAFFFFLLVQKYQWKETLYCITFVLFIVCIVFIPWQIYIYSVFPREAFWENYFNSYKHVFEPLEGHDGSLLYYLLMIPRIFGELVFIPLAWFMYAIYKKKLAPDSLAFVAWLVLPYLFFSFVATKMPGYVMISAPAIFIILAFSINDIKNYFANAGYKKVVLVFLTLFILLPIRHSIVRVRSFRDIDRNPGWAKELRMLQSKVGETKAAVFNVEHYIEAMFYAKVSAYPFIPDNQQLQQALNRGFEVFVYDSPNIPIDIQTSANVVILQKNNW